MTQRERHASPGLSATAPAPHPPAAPADSPAPVRPSPSPPSHAPRGSLWGEVFRGASPAQQQELLSLASRPGLLYAHQPPRPRRPAPLHPHHPPPAANGSATEATAGAPSRNPADDLRGLSLISRLLQGHVGDLQPVRPVPAEPLDAGLDERQRE